MGIPAIFQSGNSATLMRCAAAAPLSGILLLAAALSFGCAYASSPNGRTLAFGADAHAEIYACGDSDARETTKINEPVFPDSDGLVGKVADAFKTPPRKITETEGPAKSTPLQESHGSAVLEPLAKVIGETGAAFGIAAGKVVVCVITLGWKCGI